MERKHPKVSSGGVPLQKGGENNGRQVPTSGHPSLTERNGAWEHHPVVRDGSVPGGHNRSRGGTAELQTKGACNHGQLGRTQEEGSGG